jgi:recombination endonuclease VII
MRRLKRWQYEELFRQQGGCCAICKKEPSSNRKLAVDHCHTNFFVRGLLCHRCNLGLGLLDDARLLEEAKTYLQRAQEFITTDRPMPRRLGCSLNAFLKKKFRKEDWRRCRDPHEKETLLISEIEDRWSANNGQPRAIAKNLGISESRVKRLIDGNRRYPDPVFYKSSEILWLKGKPDKAQRKRAEPRS